MTPITAEAEAGTASTVTVTTRNGPDRTWSATAIDITDEGALLVGEGEKDGIDSVFAIYAPGHWASASLDDHRAPGGTGLAARITELEAVISDISGAAWHENTTVERLEVIRERLRRYRETGK